MGWREWTQASLPRGERADVVRVRKCSVQAKCPVPCPSPPKSAKKRMHRGKFCRHGRDRRTLQLPALFLLKQNIDDVSCCSRVQVVQAACQACLPAFAFSVCVVCEVTARQHSKQGTMAVCACLSLSPGSLHKCFSRDMPPLPCKIMCVCQNKKLEFKSCLPQAKSKKQKRSRRSGMEGRPRHAG